jgi:hypothetical protein
MNDQTLTSEQRTEQLQGVGCKRKRVEDIYCLLSQSVFGEYSC